MERELNFKDVGFLSGTNILIAISENNRCFIFENGKLKFDEFVVFSAMNIWKCQVPEISE